MEMPVREYGWRRWRRALGMRPHHAFRLPSKQTTRTMHTAIHPPPRHPDAHFFAAKARCCACRACGVSGALLYAAPLPALPLC
eukprot:350486-Chlamydomonas_euryale.AAC.1